MAPMFGAVLVLCLILAGTSTGLAQDITLCQTQVNACTLTYQSDVGDYSISTVCRATTKYFACLEGITSCGESYTQIVQPIIDEYREKLRQVGCGAEGTAVVSMVTLLLSLAAARVWGQS